MTRQITWPKPLFYDYVAGHSRGLLTEVRKRGEEAVVSVMQQAQSAFAQQFTDAHYYVRRAEAVLAAKVFVITPELTRTVYETAQRAFIQRAVAELPVPPALPLWLDFPDGQMGNDDFVIRGILIRQLPVAQSPFFVTTEAFSAPGGETVHLRRVQDTPASQYLRPEMVLNFELWDTPGTRTFVDTVNYAQGHCWALDQMGACAAHECPIGRQTRPGYRYRVSGLDLTDRLRALAPTTCQCYLSGSINHYIMWALLYALSAEGAQHTIVERAMRPDPTAPKHVRRKQQEEMEAYNRTHPRYTQISLGEVKHYVHAGRSAPKEQRTLAVTEEEQTPVARDLTNVDASVMRQHWRLLIPGPGKPWRGDTARLVLVHTSKPYIHHQRRAGAPAMRFIVTE